MSPRVTGKSEHVYRAAERWIDGCLRGDGSLFSGDAIWTAAQLDDLHTRFVGRPDTSQDVFEAKLARQLDDAPDATIQLAAELLFVHLLPASNIGGRRKRELVSQILGWMSAPVSIPSELDEVFDMGIISMGVAFNTGRNFGIAFLLDFVRSWKQLPTGERDKLLAEAAAFKTFLWSLPMFAAQAQREVLLHLVHPDTFEDIAYGQHKKDIVDAFRERLKETTDDVDRQLAQIRHSLAAELGSDFSFYRPDVYEKWHRETPEHPAEETGGDLPVSRRAWLIRGTTRGGVSLVPTWLEGSFVSIGWAEIGSLEPGISRNEIRARLADAFPEHSAGKIGLSAGMVDRFMNRIQIGDLVVTPRADDVFIGVVTSEPYWHDVAAGEPGALARRREVEWRNPRRPFKRTSVSEGLYSKMRTLLTLTDVTDFADEIARLAGLKDELVLEGTAPTRTTLPEADQKLEDATLLPPEWLQETLDLLERKRQVVFYGPPGTGKTFVAQRFGDHIVDAGGNFRLVQFHPSYTYEDFFEGFRPRSTETGGGISFELVGGPMREITEAALDDPSHPYLLIIDEINRANIAKVFGELYFLLEYRDAAVSLLYSPDREFTLPKNLYIIGTMNTADRSIALIDTAMRRRFYFLRFSPEVEPVRSLFRRWLRDRSLGQEPAVLLEALNAELDDPDFSIGPSYLMDERILDEGELERVWTHALMPLLEEHFFGADVDVHTRFGLPALQERIHQGSDAEAGLADDGSSGDA